MKLDVLSVLQPSPAPSPGDLGAGSDSTPGADAPAQAFAAVFAELMPGAADGQNLAVVENLSTGEEPTSAEPEPDPALAWLNMPALFNVGTQLGGLALQSQAVGPGQMQLITPSQPSSDIEGDALVAFAQGQGLDDAALQRLFGDQLPTKPVPTPGAVVSAAAWLTGGQKSMGVHVPVVDPDVVVLPEPLALERGVLNLAPGKRLVDGGPLKLPEPTDSGVSVGEDGRVDLDLDVAGLLGELAPEADLKALKAEERAALSLRIGEMLAQRMVVQAQRGQWQLRFALNPQNLGRVEIDMQMRGGELEATLGAMNPATRELLQDALPRLREMLQQSGMDVASLNIGSGGASKNGGQPTPQAMASGPNGSPASGAEVQPDVPTPQGRSQGADGWDIWV
jgi:hypothetical protein